MRKVKTVIAMSDLHLGRDLGYLYSKDPRFQSNRGALLDLLTDLGPQDELVLNGDLLELSQAGLDQAYGELKEFLVLLSQSPGFKRIVYVPGNHDHHFWRELAEHVCVNGQIAQGLLPPSNLEYPSYFVDKHFSSANPNLPSSILLSELWPKDKPAVEIVVKYPHHLVNVLNDGGQSRNYLFAHGHFLEDLLTPINYLIEPARLDELEAFNNMWIEAIDYDFGRSGRLMEAVQDLVKKVEEGNKEAKRELQRVLAEIYLNCARKLKLNWLKRAGLWLIKAIVTSFVGNLPIERKSGLSNAAIDEKLKARIVEYICKYVLKRYQKGKAAEYNFPSDKDIPLPLTFVFGHTHRPAADDDHAFVSIDDAVYPLANTGGWLRTDGTGAANGENAGILVINEMGAHWKSLKGGLQ